MNKKVKINGLNYDLVFGNAGRKEDRTPLWGLCDYNNSKLVISNLAKMSPERKFDVFMHECIHALLYETCVEKYLKDKNKEAFVEQLSVPLAAFIRDNMTLLRKMGRF